MRDPDPCAAQEGKTHRFATNSFLVEGADGYSAFKGGRVVARDKLLSDVLSTYIREKKMIEPPIAGRLVPA